MCLTHGIMGRGAPEMEAYCVREYKDLRPDEITRSLRIKGV